MIHQVLLDTWEFFGVMCLITCFVAHVLCTREVATLRDMGDTTVEQMGTLMIRIVTDMLLSESTLIAPDDETLKYPLSLGVGVFLIASTWVIVYILNLLIAIIAADDNASGSFGGRLDRIEAKQNRIEAKLEMLVAMAQRGQDNQTLRH